MKVKISFFKCFIIALFIIGIIIFLIFALSNKSVPIGERNKIKEFISNNYSSFSLKDIDKGANDGYEISVEFDGPELTLSDSVTCYKELLDYVSEEKMTLYNVPITFEIRAGNDSSPTTIILSDRSDFTEEFNYSYLRYVHVSSIANDLSILDDYSKEIQELKIFEMSDPHLPDIEQFEALKKLTVSGCHNSNGEDILSKELIGKLEEKGIEYN